MVPPLDILPEYWIEHVISGLLYLKAMFTFPTRIWCRVVPGFSVDCPCGVWCRRLTTCLLYDGPLFRNLDDNRFVSLQKKTTFSLFRILMPHNNMVLLYFRLPYFQVSNSASFPTQYFSALILYRRSLDTSYYLTTDLMALRLCHIIR